jgi:O-antigen/teichoic acid export membrane protein
MNSSVAEGRNTYDSVGESVTSKATRSIKWLFLIEGIPRAISPITFIILARLLTPEDYGLIAVAQIAISFSQLFWDAGLEKALIQTNEPLKKAANVVFWVNASLGLCLYLLLFVLAPQLSIFFNSPASMPVLRVMGLQILIGSLTTVQQALFVRDLNFRQLFWVRMAKALLPAFFSLPLAFLGYGVWALVAGSMVGSILTLFILWKKSSWRPAWSFDKELAHKLLWFGIWIVGDSLIGWFISYGDNVIIGRFLGVTDLGVYRTGIYIITVLTSLTLNPFLPILYPTFSRLQNDIPALTALLHKVNRLIMALILPIGVGLMLVSSLLVPALFGAKWQGLDIVLSVMGLQTCVGWFVGANPDAYRAVGRPDVQTKLGLATVLLYISAYLIAAPLGLKVFVFTRLGLAVAAMPIHIYLAVRLLKVSPLYLWHTGKSMMLATLAMAISVASIKWFLLRNIDILPNMMSILILISAGGIVYTAVLLLLDRAFVMDTRKLVIKAVHA